MPFALPCDCGRSMRITEDLIGRKVRCPVCNAVHLVKQPDDVVDEVVEVASAEESTRDRRGAQPRSSRVLDVEPDDDDDAPRPTKRRPAKRAVVSKKSGGFGTSSAGVLGGILMMVVAVVWLVVGLALGILFFYPFILFVIGIAAMVKGIAGGD